MFEYISIDIRRHFDIDGRENRSLSGCAFVLFFAYGLHATIIYRYGRYIERFSNSIVLFPFYWCLDVVYRLCHWLVKRLYGIDICRKAKIGKGFYIGHFGGIKVSECEIGDICSIHQLTKIEDSVIIDNNVWIGGHAVVAAGVHIKEHASVTAAARVTRTVESYCLVSGNPARTIKINFDNSDKLGMHSGVSTSDI